MRGIHALLNFTESSLIIMNITLSYYTLTQCNLYKILMKALSSILSIQHLNIIFYIVILGIALTFMAIGKGAYQKVYRLAWIIYLPALLSFSKLDWLAVFGFPINLESLATSISLTETLIVGVTLVGGRTFIYFFSQLKDLRINLLARGAATEEVDAVIGSAFAYTLALTALSILIVLAAWILLPPMETALKAYFTKAPYTYVLLSLTAVFITTLCVLIYLRTRSQSL